MAGDPSLPDVAAAVTSAADSVVERLQAVETTSKETQARVADHDVVIGELTAHLDDISVSFKAAVANIEGMAAGFAAASAWLKAKPTKILIVLVLGVFLGPDGVAHVKDILGL